MESGLHYSTEMMRMSVMKKVGRLFVVGAILLVVGYLVQWYPNTVIVGLEDRLENPGLPQDRRSDLLYTIDWWETQRIAVFNPVGTIFMIVGLLVVVYAIVHFIAVLFKLT